MTREEAKIITSNVRAGYIIYAKPTTSSPTGWMERRPVNLVLESPSRPYKKGKLIYRQDLKGQEELSRAYIELHKNIFSRRLKAV